MPKQKNKPSQDQAIHYNENVAKYAASDKSKAAAAQAKRAVSDPREAAALKKAEKKGKSRARAS